MCNSMYYTFLMPEVPIPGHLKINTPIQNPTPREAYNAIKSDAKTGIDPNEQIKNAQIASRMDSRLNRSVDNALAFISRFNPKKQSLEEKSLPEKKNISSQEQKV